MVKVTVVVVDEETGTTIEATHEYDKMPVLIGIEVPDAGVELETSFRQNYDEWFDKFQGNEFNILTAPPPEERWEGKWRG